MRSENYRNYFKSSFMMGPNCLRLLDEILEEYPLHYTSDNLVLDLGCGMGVTSLFIANETGATVYANDLWISEEENRKRFASWNMQDKLLPMQEDATDLHFNKEMFDAFLREDGYFNANYYCPTTELQSEYQELVSYIKTTIQTYLNDGTEIPDWI
jgi:cyclopropane fatty-acyl-phospholipid synthase-like methyltransferase